MKTNFLTSYRGIFIVLIVMGFVEMSCKKGASPADDDIIRIGEYGSMTGNDASFGVSTHNGVTMVIDQVNEAGGIRGKKIKLISLDDEGKPEVAVNVATRLITQDKVHVLLGEVASSRSLAVAPIAQRYRIPMVTPASTNPKVTAVGDFVFRVCFTDPFQGAVIAKFAAENLKLKKAAIITDRKNDYSVGLSEVFRNRFKELGGEIVAEQNFVSGDIDFKAQLTDVRGKNPDVVVVTGYYSEVGLMLKQARELGMKMPFMGGDGWDSPKLFDIAGKALEPSYISNHYSVEDQDPKVQDFVNRYKARFNQVPDSMAALGHDAALVIVDALKRAKSLSGEDIRDALAQTKDFSAVTGIITIDAERNAKKPAVVLEVKEKAYKFVTRVFP